MIGQLKAHPQFLGKLKRELGEIGGYTDPFAPCRRPGPKRGERAKGGDDDFVLLFFACLLLKRTSMYSLTDQPEAFTAIWQA